MTPDDIKEIPFDYCLIAVKKYDAIVEQCLRDCLIPEEKILLVEHISKWSTDLRNCIFEGNILGDSRNYTIANIKMDLGEGHALPAFQKSCKMYDRFIPYLARITQGKEGKYIIDIGANVGDTLAAMWNDTEDCFLCIEPVEEFFLLLTDNIRRLGNPDRVHTERAFVTDKMEEVYSPIVSEYGTATKKRNDSDAWQLIPSKTVDYLIKEKRIDYKDIDLLKIDTDGFDADCILSAKELLGKGNALIFWENYSKTCAQYKKCLEAHDVLQKNGYSVFFIFDNYGNYLCKGNLDTANSILNYVQRVRTGCIGNTFSYFDVLTCKIQDEAACEKYIEEYLQHYPLFRISR